LLVGDLLLDQQIQHPILRTLFGETTFILSLNSLLTYHKSEVLASWWCQCATLPQMLRWPRRYCKCAVRPEWTESATLWLWIWGCITRAVGYWCWDLDYSYNKDKENCGMYIPLELTALKLTFLVDGTEPRPYCRPRESSYWWSYHLQQGKNLAFHSFTLYHSWQSIRTQLVSRQAQLSSLRAFRNANGDDTGRDVADWPEGSWEQRRIDNTIGMNGIKVSQYIATEDGDAWGIWYALVERNRSN
jgi:hypothetical protein